MLEIERTFLVQKLPEDLGQYKAIPIKQGYLTEPPSPLRIRQKGDKFEKTQKFFTGESRAIAEERNEFISKGEFDSLWPQVLRSLEKTRYIIPLGGGLTAELDVFGGKLTGLQWVEVEFKDEDQMKSFVSPDWFGRDITEEEFSANLFMAGKTYEEIKKFYLRKKRIALGIARPGPAL